MEISIGIDPLTGLEMFREIDYFIGGIREEKITVYYYQWLKSPNGIRLNEVHKKYFVKNIPAITEVQYQYEDILDENNNVIGQNVVGQTIVEIVPAYPGYTSWREKVITNAYVGATLGNDIIIGSINATLAGMSVDVEDNHVTR